MSSHAGSKESRRIRRMFAGIAGTYDLLNHLLSLNADRSWRREAVRLLEPRAGERLLDLCTGTADLALEIARGTATNGGAESGGAGGIIVGADFCLEMLRIGEGKRRSLEGSGKKAPPVRLLLSDCLRLPFPDSTFDAAAVAFGARNLEDLPSGLREIFRVLRPGGRAAILEFTTPPGALFRALYGIYFHKVLPLVGRLVARPGGPDALGAYSYLPASVRGFPDARSLTRVMEEAGFARIRFRLLSRGIACIHLGERFGALGEGAAHR